LASRIGGEKEMNIQNLEPEYSGKRQIRGKGSVCIMTCVVTVALLMGLVALRLYCLNLEYRLAGIQNQIVAREEEQSRLEKDLASLLNPTRVYSYARSELGMRASANIGLVKIAGTESRPSGPVSPDPETGKIRRALVRLVDAITGKASARQ
jgi:cell division protein FtsL